MDVLGMYLLQRVSDELTIQRYSSFEKRFTAPVPDSTAAKVAQERYLSSSNEVPSRVREGAY